MTIPRLPAVTIVLLLALLFTANLFGAQLNRLFLALPGIDKVLHVGFHVVLFPCLYLLATRITADRRRRTQLAVACGLLIAVSDEFVQGLTSTRTVEFADLVADTSGIALGWIMTVRPRRAVAVAVGGIALSAAVWVTYQTHTHLRDYARGLQYERQRDYVSAREYYLRALASGLRTPGLLNALGWVEIESGHGDARQAVEWARTALEMQPRNADILDTYGWALHHAGRSTEALQPLLDAYEKNPTIFCIHYHLGEVYRALGRPEEARTHFLEQLKLPATREATFARKALTEMGERP